MLIQKDKMKKIDMAFRWRKLFIGLMAMILVATINGCAGLSSQEQFPEQNVITTNTKKSETGTVQQAEDIQKNPNELDGTIKVSKGESEMGDSENESLNSTPVDESGDKDVKSTLNKKKKNDENVTRILIEPEKRVDIPANRNRSDADGQAINFDNADIYEVVRTIAEILDINYIIDPNAKGAVSIHTTGEISREDILPLFYQILEINGLTMVREGEVYKIIQSTDTIRHSLLTLSGRNYENIPIDERPILQIIPLRYISASEITTIITPFLSSNAFTSSHRKNLLVMDKALNIKKLLKLIDVFDINLMDQYYHRTFHVVHISVTEAESLLNSIFTTYGVGKENLTLIPVERANLLIAISDREDYFERIDAFLSQFDIPTADTEPRIYIYSVRNGRADDLSTLLQNVFSDGDISPTETAKATEGEERKNTALFGKQRNTESNEGMSGGRKISGDIRINPDLVRNALIIEATPKDYLVIESILNQIDIPPRQVLIEVTIAEIELGNETELGVNWYYTHGVDNSADTVGIDEDFVGADFYESITSIGEGLQYIVGQTKQWKAILAAKATDSKVNLLSSPSILATDNKEAKIEISTQTPVLSTQYTNTESSIVTTNVQYKDTGIILSVIPHINENGLVSMELSQEVSDTPSTSTDVEGVKYPSFFKRSLETTLVVRNNQTIVIGGLIKEEKSLERNGIPFLSKIPIIGFLFGSRTNDKEKRELILLITPRVITDMTEVDEVTENFRRKVAEVRNWMESVK